MEWQRRALAGAPRAVRASRWVALAAVLLGLAACAGRSRNPFDQSPEAQGLLSLFLDNRGFNDVRVYAVTSSGRRSLGSVPGNSVRRTTLEWRQLDQISFRIDVLAGRTYTTHAVAASPGDRVELIIPDNPADALVRFSR
ncbi:MAG TPA: hypothetical protein VJ997_05365 [Longimicrobiales bacterium]|nr:hypothetical protein [Longimicrobiales bacterium]